MKPDELLSVLREFHREKLAIRQRHVAVARHVGGYEFNNAYQYIIAREDVHLEWLEAAIADLDGTPDTVGEPAIPAPGKKDSVVPLLQQDAREAGEFAARWRARVGGVTNARHRTMMQVVIGETLEHQRFFEQMAGGNLNVLGRRANGPGKEGTGDGVMGVRWIE